MRTRLLSGFLLLLLGPWAVGAANGEDALRVFVCGSSSPLLDLNRAKACIAVVTERDFFLFDTGSGSGGRLSAGRLPVPRLSGVFLTHFHSDHISDLYNINLTSWASGRKYALPVYGPAGIRQVVGGMNDAYALDRGYRVAHHGPGLLKPAHGLLVPREIEPGVVYERGDFVVTAVPVDHAPIEPAFGYRVDYGDRSVVISGGTVVSEALMEASRGVDLLLHDALSPAILDRAIKAASAAGRTVRAQILRDVVGYHAHAADVAQAAAAAEVGTLAFYHLVPPPQDEAQKAVFMAGIPDEVVMTVDRMWFELPRGSTEVRITTP